MSAGGPAGPAPAASVWSMYRAMVGVAVFCGLLIVTVYEWTAPVIARNRAEALERAIFEVLPDARSSRTFHVREDGSVEAPGTSVEGAPRVHVGYDEAGRLAGFAVEAQGMGYQDVIRILYGYSSRDEAVVGFRVLESRETPGLGTRIETDPAFLENFRRLDVSLGADGRIAHPIESVKKGEKRHAWQVDSITGATISSRAIAEMLRSSTAWWIPRLEENLDRFEEAS